ncbi:MAG: hypothetical protein ABSF46_23145 [Terriglobia bacterium]|jgi:hypothetical protein
MAEESTENREPWERQPRESSKAYAHLSIYLEMGISRSLNKVASDPKCTSKRRQLSRWSSKYKWVQRSLAFDDDQRRQEREAQRKEHNEMLKRHARLAMLGQSLVVDTLRKRLQEAQENPTKMLSVSDASRLLDVSVRVERLSRGLPSEVSELGGSADRPVRLSIEQQARRAIENVLGINGPVIERTEPEEGEAEAQPEAAPDIPDPFVG